MSYKSFFYIFLIIFLGIGSIFSQNQTKGDTMEYQDLTKEEKRVIIDKGTEKPNTGKYVDHSETGTYICKRCQNPLFHSGHKFHSGCGWPSFDDEIPGSIRRQPDPDGRRTEILCANCGAHLGHVFKGEGLTEKNLRHCVNSIAMEFVPQGDTLPIQKAFFAAGCFWGVEHHFKKVKGVFETRVGYSGGNVKNPSYEQVCAGTTGHKETVEVLYDPTTVSYEELVKTFFEIHDFTQKNGQGPDIGEQYKSYIFNLNEKQKEIAQSIIDTLKSRSYKVATKVEKGKNFYPAIDYHQDYYSKNNKAPYCHNRKDIF